MNTKGAGAARITWMIGASTLILISCGPATDSAPEGSAAHVSADRPDLLHVESHMAAHPTDPGHLTLAAVVASPDGGTTWVDAFVSDDGGSSWRRVSLRDRLTNAVDPWVDYDQEGVIYLSVLDTHPELEYRLGVKVFRSVDGGRSFEGPADVPWGDGGSYDHPTLVVDRTEGPLGGTVYVAGDHWGARPAQGPRPDPIGVSRSNDGGRTFAGPVDVAADALFSRTAGPSVVLQDGTLLISYRDNWDSLQDRMLDPASFWVARSTDGGASFDPPTLVTDRHGTFSGVAMAVGTTSPDSGQRVLVPTLAEGRTELRLLASDDGGQSFGDLGVIARETEPGRAFLLADIAVNALGAVAVSWMTSWEPRDGRSCFERLLSISSDLDRWHDPVVITPDPSCVDVPGDVRVQRMDTGEGDNPFHELFWMGGHYAGLTTSADGSFHVAWADARTGAMQVYHRRFEQP